MLNAKCKIKIDFFSSEAFPTTQFPFPRNFEIFFPDIHIFLSVLFEMTCTSSYYVLISLIPSFLWRFLSCLLSALAEVHVSYLTSCHVFISPYVLYPSDISNYYTYTYRYAFLPSHFVFSFSYYFWYSYSIYCLLLPSS